MRFDRWDISGFDRDKAALLCKSGTAPVNPLVAAIWASRGITEPDEVQKMLDSEYMPFHDPYLMADMDKAVRRIKKAVNDKEYIAVYGDYDVDGMTSAALLALWLDSKGARYEIYIPGRFEEGYGINTGALDTLKSRGVQLVITVDCGITAVTETQYAKDIGLDLVITDHHESRAELPAAEAVVNPKRPDCAYPYKSLAGVGVVCKLIYALEDGGIDDELAALCGQLTALGTVADVMPVLGENRRLILDGLHFINSDPCPGLRSLIEDSPAVSSNVTATTISYMLAPRLNAAGRMGDPLLSVKLLLSRDRKDAEQYTAQLCRLNDERRSLEQDIHESALEQLGTEVPDEPIILAGRGWHQGVTGIVAAKIADRFLLPAVIISIDENGLGHGSCRSFGSFSIYDALSSCSDLIVTFGGHEMAAGITVAEDKIDALRQRISDCYRIYAADAPKHGLRIDFEVVKPRQLLTVKNIEALTLLEPYGRDNPPPCLCITEATVMSIISVGTGRHTKLKLRKSDSELDCIFFSVPPEKLGVSTGDSVDIAFEPQINTFRGLQSAQLQLADIRKSR